MALTPQAIWDFIEADDHTPANILNIVNTLTPIDFSGPLTNPRNVWLLAFVPLLIEHMVPAYIEILHVVLFRNASSSAMTQQPFAHEIVEFDEPWIRDYLDATRLQTPPGVIPIQLADRDRLIRALIDQYVGQYVDVTDPHPPPAKDTRRDLIALLENCRDPNHGQPEFIQYAFNVSFNLEKDGLQIEITRKYRNEQLYLDLLVNGVAESTGIHPFIDLNELLTDIGAVPGTQVQGAAPGVLHPDRTPLQGPNLTAADGPAIQALLRSAAYSLNSANLALVLQPLNLAQVPALVPFLQPIRDAVTNMTQESPFPAALTGIPGHYLELVTQQPTGKTLAEKAAEVGNVAVMDALIAAGITVTGKPLMQIALTGEHYTIAQSLWNHDHNYPDPWFPPGFIVNDAKLTRDTSAPYFFPWSEQFRNTFYTKYGIFNPGSLTGVARSTVGRAAAAALGIPTSRGPALSLVEQQTKADVVIRMLQAMPDFVPSSTKDTLNLLTLSSIRDEIVRITDPTVWDSKMLLPLIAKKGAVADGTVLPKADLLAAGLANGADPNVMDATGSTALHYVATLPVRPLGSRETRLTTPRSILMLKTLLASPTLDINKVNATGYTALHLIMLQPRPSVEHLTLLSRAPKLDYNVVAGGNTALIQLIFQHPAGQPNPTLSALDDVVQILLKNSDMTVKDNTGHTALWNAINYTGDDDYLVKILPGLAKGLPDLASEVALIQLKPLPLTRAKLMGLNLAATATAAAMAMTAANLPTWLPDEYKAILSDDTLDPAVKGPILQHIQELDQFLRGRPSSDSDAIMTDISNSNFWWLARTVKAYPIPVVSAIPIVGGLMQGPLFYDANQPTTFNVLFEDGSQNTLRVPYKAAYRSLPTTIYNPNGTPTLAAGFTPADQTAAQANNDVLVKLVGKQYITASNQRFLKKILDELYYAQFNPSLGNDPLTAMLHLRSKMDSLMKYHGLAQKNIKQLTLAKLGTTLTTFITNLISGLGLRFPTAVPVPLGFPTINFVGVSTHAATFVAAGIAAGGIIPIVPGLRAGGLAPPPRAGLRALGGLGGVGGGGGGGVGVGAPAALQNIFTGDTINQLIIATTFPTAITLGPEDAMTYLGAPAGPITAANAFAVAKTDSFYKFLAPFGLTAVVKGQGYILRPAELFLALFHQTPVQVAAIMRDRNHPFVRLLRDYCLPAAIGLATRKGMTPVVTELNKLRGKLPA